MTHRTIADLISRPKSFPRVGNRDQRFAVIGESGGMSMLMPCSPISGNVLYIIAVPSTLKHTPACLSDIASLQNEKMEIHRGLSRKNNGRLRLRRNSIPTTRIMDFRFRGRNVDNAPIVLRLFGSSNEVSRSILVFGTAGGATAADSCQIQVSQGLKPPIIDINPGRHRVHLAVLR